MQIVTGRRGEPHVTSRQMQAVYRSFLGDFALLDIGEKLRAEAYSNDIVRVYDGVVSVQGIYAVISYNQYDEVYIEPVSVGKKRIDTIVLHYTKDNTHDVEGMQLDVVQGEEYTDNPIAPVVPEGGDAWEGTTDIQVPIYDVEVTNFGLTVTPHTRMLTVIPTLDSIAERIPETVVTGVKGDSEVLYRDGNVNITKANIGLGNVDNTADTDKPISTATQTALNAKANTTDLGTASAKNFTTSVTQGSTDLITSGAVYNEFANLPKPEIFKGTLGVNGTITTLPTASSDNEGWEYKVITASTYAGQDAKYGDTFISDGTQWIYIPSGDETDTDTWRGINVNGSQLLGNGISSGNVNFKGGTNAQVSGSGNDITVDVDTTFTDASSRVNIASGDSIKTILGKIKKWFSDLKTVAFSGSYSDLSDKPTIPTVNNATLNIKKNGTSQGTFTANASTDVNVDISVPTKTSDLTNDSGYITESDLPFTVIDGMLCLKYEEE